MRILYVINGLGFSQNTGIGGSDKRAVEIIRHLKELDKDDDYYILTTISGANIFKKDEKLDTKYYIIDSPSWWPERINNFLLGRVLSYFYALLKSILMYKELSDYDIYFATSDYYFDIIPCFFYAKIHHKKFISMIHHHVKSPLTREGSVLNNTLLYLSQRFSFLFIKHTADGIFLYDTEEGRNIKQILFGNKKQKPKVYFVKNGIDNKLIDKAIQPDKKYDACFLGGLRPSKGINEFVPIWKIVTKNFSSAKFLVIGGGGSEIVQKLKTEVSNVGLGKSIIFTGPLSGVELYSHMKSSKLFLFPSHEEGWGIAICEAMYCGLPVICYDLPAFIVFANAIDKYEIGQYKLLVEKVVDYLAHPKKIEDRKEILVKIAQQFTWESIAKEEKDILETIPT